MANSGPNTNGSQFFISYAKQPHLNGLYTVFGRVIHGFEVLDIMEKVYFCAFKVNYPFLVFESCSVCLHVNVCGIMGEISRKVRL